MARRASPTAAAAPAVDPWFTSAPTTSGGAGAVPHRGQGDVDHLLLGDADLGHDRVGRRAPRWPQPPPGPGSGWVQVPLGVADPADTVQQRAAGVVAGPSGGVDHQLDEGRRRSVVGAVDDLADADQDRLVGAGTGMGGDGSGAMIGAMRRRTVARSAGGWRPATTT